MAMPFRLSLQTLTLCFRLASLIPFVSCADLTEGNYTFTTNDVGQATVTGLSASYSGSLFIPNTLGGAPVVAINGWTFHNRANLTSVVIPEGVTAIGYNAFYQCSGLSSVSLPNTLTSLGYEAFRECTSLTSVVIPDSVNVIGDHAFESCSGLKTLIIGNGVTSISDSAFRNCGVLSVAIPNSVTSIGNSAFYNCPALTSITVPNSVNAIGDFAFRSCSNLKTLTLGNGVTSIGNSAFAGCTALTSVILPDSVTSIGAWAFYDCSFLTTATIPSGVTLLDYSTFSDCYRLASVYFKGDAPTFTSYVFNLAPATIYYLPGTTGWGETFGDRPTAVWHLSYPVMLKGQHFGVHTNGFGFTISWATTKTFVVEARNSLQDPEWHPISTNTLVNGWSAFRDTDWANHSSRFYRVVFPTGQ